MNKKILGLFSVFVLTLLIFTGCGSTTTDEVTKIEFQHSMIEQDRIDTIQTLIDQFNEENPDIEVTQVPVNEDSYNEKIVSQGSAGELPAVMHVGKDVLGTMSDYNYIDPEAVNQVIETEGEDQFYTGVLDLSKDESGENYLMIPIDAWVQGIWYNEKVFEDKGLAVPDTYENILAAAKKLNTDGNYGIVLPTDETTFTQQVFSQIALANGANIVDEEGNITYNTPQMQTALEQYKELTTYSQEGSVTIDQVKDTFLSGKTNMVFYSTYMYPALVEAGIDGDYAFTPLKDVDGKDVAFGNPSGLTITNGLEDNEREAAIKFVEFMTAPEQVVKWNLMTVGGGLPARKDVLNSGEYQANETVQQMNSIMDVLEESLESMQSFGTVEGKNYNILGPITDARIIAKSINDVAVHDADIKTTLENGQKEMEEL